MSRRTPWLVAYGMILDDATETDRDDDFYAALEHCWWRMPPWERLEAMKREDAVAWHGPRRKAVIDVLAEINYDDIVPGTPWSSWN